MTLLRPSRCSRSQIRLSATVGDLKSRKVHQIDLSATVNIEPGALSGGIAGIVGLHAGVEPGEVHKIDIPVVVAIREPTSSAASRTVSLVQAVLGLAIHTGKALLAVHTTLVGGEATSASLRTAANVHEQVTRKTSIDAVDHPVVIFVAVRSSFTDANSIDARIGTRAEHPVVAWAGDVAMLTFALNAHVRGAGVIIRTMCIVQTFDTNIMVFITMLAFLAG